MWLKIIRFWKFIKRFKRFWLSVLLAVLCSLTLLYEWLFNERKLDISHIYLVSVIYVIAMLFWHLKVLRDWFRWIIDFLGLENLKDFRFIIVIFSASIFSIYLLGFKNSEIPFGLQFSIIPVSATLGGLVIAGANNSKLSPNSRNDLLRVAQNFIVATISFIFFAASFALANLSPSINPNVPPTNNIETIAFIFFWASVAFFFIGTFLFVIGIVDLALGLKKIKNELLYWR
jgi:hypothetical protein